MNTQKIVIIGAGYAGLITALRLSREATAQITLINATPNFTERIRLHQVSAGYTPKQYPITQMIRGRSIHFMQGIVTSIHDHSVTIDTDDTPKEIAFDRLVYALGSFPDTNAVQGIKEHAFTLHTNDVPSLRTALQNGGRVLVCGGGLTAIESVTELAEAYPHNHFTLVTRGKVGEGLSQKGREYLYRTFESLNIDICESVDIQKIEQNYVQTTMGDIDFDTCVWVGGFRAPSLASDSGIATNARGQIIVDDTLRSLSHRHIYAVGDSAYLPHIRMACATALPMGAHTADNLVAWLRNEPEKPFRFGYVFQCISLGRKRGLVQFVNADDTPQERILTDSVGAMIKEMICRYTVASLQLERRVPGYGQYWKHA
jgi:NADH:ubiquinone reductase (H+-translocating)